MALDKFNKPATIMAPFKAHWGRKGERTMKTFLAAALLTASMATSSSASGISYADDAAAQACAAKYGAVIKPATVVDVFDNDPACALFYFPTSGNADWDGSAFIPGISKD